MFPTHLAHGVLGAGGSSQISGATRADYAAAATVALIADDSAGKDLRASWQHELYDGTAALEAACLPAPVVEAMVGSDRGVAAGELCDNSRT